MLRRDPGHWSTSMLLILHKASATFPGLGPLVLPVQADQQTLTTSQIPDNPVLMTTAVCLRSERS